MIEDTLFRVIMCLTIGFLLARLSIRIRRNKL